MRYEQCRGLLHQWGLYWNAKYVAFLAIMKFKSRGKLLSKVFDTEYILWTCEVHPRCVVCIGYNTHILASFVIFKPQRPKCIFLRRMTPSVSVTSQTMNKDDIHYDIGLDIFLKSITDRAIGGSSCSGRGRMLNL